MTNATLRCTKCGFTIVGADDTYHQIRGLILCGNCFAVENSHTNFTEGEPAMITRADVYKAIDSERYYQELQEDKNGWQKKKTVGEWIVLMNHYTTELNRVWSTSKGDEEALHFMRKLAGIAVHCMEENGAPHRKV
jgi:hypothetical protein